MESAVSVDWLAKIHSSSLSAVPWLRAMTTADAASQAAVWLPPGVAALHSPSSGKCLSTNLTWPVAVYFCRMLL